MSYDGGINGLYQRVGVWYGLEHAGPLYVGARRRTRRMAKHTTNTLSAARRLEAVARRRRSRSISNAAASGGCSTTSRTSAASFPVVRDGDAGPTAALQPDDARARRVRETVAAAHGVGSDVRLPRTPGLATPGLFVFCPAAARRRRLAQLIGTTPYFASHAVRPRRPAGGRYPDGQGVPVRRHQPRQASTRWSSSVFNYSGKPTSSQVIADNVTTTGYELPAALAGSIATAGTAATASTVFDIQVNGVTKGTITFAISGTTGTFVFSSNVPLALGDVVSILAPASPDSTLANITITLNAVTV